jgi:hypothetical protein
MYTEVMATEAARKLKRQRKLQAKADRRKLRRLRKSQREWRRYGMQV